MKKLFLMAVMAGFVALTVKEFPAIRRELKMMRM
jgi:Family of unknown function (DUF6893)